MSMDLIIYALIAVGLVFWLRSVLGTRHGDERERPAPYLTDDKDLRTLPLAEAEHIPGPEEKIARLAATPGPVKKIAGKTAELGLMEIARADRGFDIDFFLEGAQDAFAMIVESYAEGDREALKGLLAPPVYAAFEQGIAARESRRETQHAEIHAIRAAEVVDARLSGKTASITVRFVAEETSVTRDELNTLISGHPDRTTQMKDVWTFGRELKSRDPSWLVYETKADDDGTDNEHIPNSH
jgi:predicted lipid-binding transport protein (Tim44 family)